MIYLARIVKTGLIKTGSVHRRTKPHDCGFRQYGFDFTSMRRPKARPGQGGK